MTFGELGRSGKKKVVQGPNSRGSDAMRGIQTGQRRRVKRTRGFFIKAGWIWEWWQLERKDVGGSARFGNGVEWSGMVLQMRIVVELCCTVLCVLCSALATVGDLRRGPCWHRIGWRWARHRPPKLSSLALPLTVPDSLARPHRKKVDSSASASLPQPDRGRPHSTRRLPLNIPPPLPRPAAFRWSVPAAPVTRGFNNETSQSS